MPRGLCFPSLIFRASKYLGCIFLYSSQFITESQGLPHHYYTAICFLPFPPHLLDVLDQSRRSVQSFRNMHVSQQFAASNCQDWTEDFFTIQINPIFPPFISVVFSPQPVDFTPSFPQSSPAFRFNSIVFPLVIRIAGGGNEDFSGPTAWRVALLLQCVSVVIVVLCALGTAPARSCTRNQEPDVRSVITSFLCFDTSFLGSITTSLLIESTGIECKPNGSVFGQPVGDHKIIFLNTSNKESSFYSDSFSLFGRSSKK